MKDLKFLLLSLVCIAFFFSCHKDEKEEENELNHYYGYVLASDDYSPIEGASVLMFYNGGSFDCFCPSFSSEPSTNNEIVHIPLTTDENGYFETYSRNDILLSEATADWHTGIGGHSYYASNDTSNARVLLLDPYAFVRVKVKNVSGMHHFTMGALNRLYVYDENPNEFEVPYNETTEVVYASKKGLAQVSIHPRDSLGRIIDTTKVYLQEIECISRDTIEVYFEL